jgi:Leucine-rich repeat (LRR) protein
LRRKSKNQKIKKMIHVTIAAHLNFNIILDISTQILTFFFPFFFLAPISSSISNHTQRNANPERLNLDKRHLTCCPVLRHEERVRLLNYQNNYIVNISNLEGLPNLIFLDLYNNSIEVVEGFDFVLFDVYFDQ